MSEWYVRDSEGVSLDLAVRPRAGRTRAGPVVGGRLKVEVKEPDESGKANDAVIRFLSKILGVGRSEIRILTGRKSRRKTVRVEAFVAPSLLGRLEQGVSK
jgi:uncharacterized protein (TIGR00251 family)